jgi:hypothetical protein
MKTLSLKAASRGLLIAAASTALFAAVALPAQAAGRWVSGDIHNHTYLTDGKSTFGDVTRNALSVYGLDYLANSEHGGTSTYDPTGLAFSSPVWRWLSLSDYSFPTVLNARAIYPERRVIQGLEWNAPTHEHVSVGIVGAGNEPSGISNFEYHFDAADTDLSRAGEATKAVTHSEPDPADPTRTITVVDIPGTVFGKNNATQGDMLTALDWLEQNYGPQSYAIVNHPSRKNLWHIGDFRAMNDVAPDVAFGFEGLPGHQAAQARGEYGNFIAADGSVTTDPALADATLTAHARTYGGADWMTSQVGGVWDALLGEGRHWWVFDNSDYHSINTAYKDAAGNTVGLANSDFWPGQYAKTYTYVDRFTDEGIVNGMRSGNVFVANGDLVNGLKFTVTDGKRSATMGGTLNTTAGKTLTVSIAVHSPKENGNGDPVKLNHVDLISGEVTGLIPAEVNGAPNPAYTASDTNSSTKVAKTFSRSSWSVRSGWKVMTFKVKASKDMYFRLRGTNWADGATNQTDAKGNPLVDELAYIDFANPKTGGLKPDGSPDLIHGSTPDNAWADLWFYANPVFVNVK